MIKLLISLVWISFGVLSYGLMFHYFQTRFCCFGWPNRKLHIVASIAAGICGPIGLLSRVMVGWNDEDKTPWRVRYRIVTPEESWDAYHRLFPGLTKKDWINA